MRFPQLFFALLLLTSIAHACKVPAQTDRIDVSIPTVAQEATSIWRTINDIEFLEQQGYQVQLPEGQLITDLITKSRNGAFGNDDYPDIYQFLETTAYNTENYQAALDKVIEQKPLINDIIQRVVEQKDAWDWGFKVSPSYPVTFTLYGSGGSYNPDEGSITLFTTPAGEFKRYRNPANTIVHEFTHLGMEASIVQRYQLPHPLKELVVDKFVFLLFGDKLPEYRVQDMGPTVLDGALMKRKDLAELDTTLKRALSGRE